MGADFAYTLCPRAKFTPERAAELNEFTASIEDCTNDNILETQEQLDSWLEEFAMHYWGMPSLRDTAPILVYNQAKNRAVPSLISGGMSWGDTPTESLEEFDRVAAVPALWELLTSWAMEDYYGNDSDHS